MKDFRFDWKHLACNGGYLAWPNIIFIGNQKGCAQALKDCVVQNHDQRIWGLDKAEYSLASTGRVNGKAKASLAKRKGSLQVG